MRDIEGTLEEIHTSNLSFIIYIPLVCDMTRERESDVRTQEKSNFLYIYVHFMEEIWLHLSSTYLLQKMHKILYLSPCGCHGYSEIKGIDVTF